MKDAVVTLVTQIAAAHGLCAEVKFTPGYPMTVNDERETALVEATVKESFGKHRFQPLAHPLTGSEDFSRILAEAPGSLVMLGAAPPGAAPHGCEQPLAVCRVRRGSAVRRRRPRRGPRHPPTGRTAERNNHCGSRLLNLHCCTGRHAAQRPRRPHAREPACC
jgi:metal-dependent amidase/aminoacylase/carboxypeptidase family protein